MSACQGCTEGGEGARTEGSIHNILQIEFDLDRPRGLRTVDGCTVNPADQCRGYGAGGWCTEDGACPLRGRRREEWALVWLMDRSEYGPGGVME